MKIHELKPKKGTRTGRKRKGRGIGSGLGKTSGRGHKGQKSRSGTKKIIAFEGGQMPLIRRIPKRGFSSQSKINYNVVNIEKLNIFKDESVVTPLLLKTKGIISTTKRPVKLLGKGSIKKKLKIVVNAFSKPAKDAVEKAGGSIQLIDKKK